jgi:predicted Zn-ribbon and HTH transcriptional regulator
MADVRVQNVVTPDDRIMVNCPKCQSEVVSARREWDTGHTFARGHVLHFKVFACSACGSRFKIVTKTSRYPLLGTLRLKLNVFRRQSAGSKGELHVS